MIARLSALGLVFTLTFACAHTQPSLPMGQQPEALGYIPARIAVLPCTRLPATAVLAGRTPDTASDADLANLCLKYDQFVLSGFEGQPYMRGLSPSLVKKLLTQNQTLKPIDETLTETWRYEPNQCQGCDEIGNYYREVVAKRGAWLSYLNQFSRQVGNADALLLPLVIYGQELKVLDRGQSSQIRRAKIALLLIDTNNGVLIWQQVREAEAVRRILQGEGKQAVFPDWSEVTERLLIDSLLRDFPGRQQLK